MITLVRCCSTLTKNSETYSFPRTWNKRNIYQPYTDDLSQTHIVANSYRQSKPSCFSVSVCFVIVFCLTQLDYISLVTFLKTKRQTSTFKRTAYIEHTPQKKITQHLQQIHLALDFNMINWLGWRWNNGMVNGSMLRSFWTNLIQFDLSAGFIDELLHL